MNLIKKFKSETPRIVGFLQLGLTLVTGMGTVLSIIPNPSHPIALGITITTTVITTLLQFFEKDGGKE